MLKIMLDAMMVNLLKKTIMLTMNVSLMMKNNWGVISNQQEEIKSSPMSQICLRQQRLTMNYAPKKTFRKDLKIQKGWVYNNSWADTNKDTSAHLPYDF